MGHINVEGYVRSIKAKVAELDQLTREDGLESHLYDRLADIEDHLIGLLENLKVTRVEEAEEMDPRSPDLHRKLNDEDSKEFRSWARENYIVGQPISEVWHPEVQEECKRMNLEASDARLNAAIFGECAKPADIKKAAADFRGEEE